MDAGRMLPADRALRELRGQGLRAVRAEAEVATGDEDSGGALAHAYAAEGYLRVVLILQCARGLEPRACSSVPAAIAHPDGRVMTRQGRER